MDNIRFLFFQKDIVAETTIEYSQACSLHGVQYIFESGGKLVASRVIWLALSIAAAVLGIVWSVEVAFRFLSQNMYTEIFGEQTVNAIFFMTGLCKLAGEPYSELSPDHRVTHSRY